MNDIFSKIEQSDLTDDLQIIAEVCGIETVRSLLRNCGGMSIYVPKISRLDNFVFRYMKENKEKTFKQIARELGVSEQYIKKLFRNSSRR